VTCAGNKEQAADDKAWAFEDKPLFTDSPYTVRTASFLILDTLSRASIPKTKMNEVWDLIDALLPNGHSLPPIKLVRANLAQASGTAPVTIDVCREHCILYRNRDRRLDPRGEHQHAKAVACPVCGQSRYKNPRASPSKRRAYKKFTWMGINKQLARRLWNADWRDALRMDLTVP
jgi:hypothetical protein